MPIEHPVEQHPQLEPGQVRAQAEVRADAERDVVVGLAVGSERLRVRRSASRRNWPTRTAAAPGRLRTACCAAELVVVGERAVHVLDRRDPAQHLLDRLPDPAPVGQQRTPSARGLRSSCSMPPAMTWRVVSSPPMRISRVSPMHVLVGQPLAVDLGVQQDADQIVGRLDASLGDDPGRVLVVGRHGAVACCLAITSSSPTPLACRACPRSTAGRRGGPPAGRRACRR